LEVIQKTAAIILGAIALPPPEEEVEEENPDENKSAANAQAVA